MSSQDELIPRDRAKALEALRDSSKRLQDNQKLLRRRYYEMFGFYPLDSEIFSESDIVEGELVRPVKGLLGEGIE